MKTAEEKLLHLKCKLFYLYIATKTAHFTYLNENRLEMVVGAFNAGDYKRSLGEGVSFISDCLYNLIQLQTSLFV